MSFPEGLPTTLLTYAGTSPAGGGPAAGTVRLEPNVPAVTVDGYGRVFSGAGVYKFNQDGNLADAQGNVGVRILPNDVPGTNPRRWLWLVTETITGAPKRTYYMAVSVDQEEADLSRQQELDPDSPQYVPVAGPKGDQGERGEKGDKGDAGSGGGGTDGALLIVNNLSDLDDATAARTSLGLGTAATQAATAFDAAGAAVTASDAAIAAAASDATTKAGGAQAAAQAHADAAVSAEVDRADAAYDADGAATTAAAAALSSANTHADTGDTDTLAAAKEYADAVAAAALVSAKAYTDTHSGGGGGGGIRPVIYADDLNAGIIVLTAAADWTTVVGPGMNGSGPTPVSRTVTGVVTGDVIELKTAFLRIGTVFFLDGRFVVDGSPGRYLSSINDGLHIAGPEGYAPWYNQLSFKEATGDRTFVLTEDDISSDGTFTIEMVYQGSGISDTSQHIYFGNGYQGYFDIWHWPLGAR